jgi:DNA-binding NtrC family response regulator
MRGPSHDTHQPHLLIRDMHCILVVDHDASILQLIKEILQHFGFSVLLASTARKAIGLLDCTVHALITDMDLRDITFAELVDATRTKHPGLPVCCMGASGPKCSRMPDQVCYLSKPFHVQDVLRTVAELGLRPKEIDSPPHHSEKADAANQTERMKVALVTNSEVSHPEVSGAR